MSVPLMLFVTPGMVITLINHMLGGEDVVAVEDDYRYSDVERALYKRIVEYMTGTLKDGFSNYVSIVFSVEHVEENPTMVQDVGLDETVAIIILNVDISGQAQEKVKICLPGNLLTVITVLTTASTWQEDFLIRIIKRRSWIISVTPNCLLQDSLARYSWI